MTLSSGLESVSQSGDVIYKKNADGGRVEMHKMNGSDGFLTAIVTDYGETAPDVDLCGNGEQVLGVIIGTYTPYEVDLTHDSDSCLDDNQDVQVYIPNNGDWLYGTVATATAITISTWVDVSGGFLTTGNRTAHIGVAKQAAAGASGTEYIILYEWDKGL